ncbi:MAG: hypothetical protein EZS28_049408, partial [Streblomastix strix]
MNTPSISGFFKDCLLLYEAKKIVQRASRIHRIQERQC